MFSKSKTNSESGSKSRSLDSLKVLPKVIASAEISSPTQQAASKPTGMLAPSFTNLARTSSPSVMEQGSRNVSNRSLLDTSRSGPEHFHIRINDQTHMQLPVVPFGASNHSLSKPQHLDCPISGSVHVSTIAPLTKDSEGTAEDRDHLGVGFVFRSPEVSHPKLDRLLTGMLSVKRRSVASNSSGTSHKSESRGVSQMGLEADVIELVRSRSIRPEKSSMGVLSAYGSEFGPERPAFASDLPEPLLSKLDTAVNLSFSFQELSTKLKICMNNLQLGPELAQLAEQQHDPTKFDFSANLTIPGSYLVQQSGWSERIRSVWRRLRALLRSGIFSDIIVNSCPSTDRQAVVADPNRTYTIEAGKLPLLPEEYDNQDILAIAMYYFESNQPYVCAHYLEMAALQSNPIGAFLLGMLLLRGDHDESTNRSARKAFPARPGEAFKYFIKSINFAILNFPTVDQWYAVRSGGLSTSPSAFDRFSLHPVSESRVNSVSDDNNWSLRSSRSGSGPMRSNPPKDTMKPKKTARLKNVGIDPAGDLGQDGKSSSISPEGPLHVASAFDPSPSSRAGDLARSVIDAGTKPGPNLVAHSPSFCSDTSHVSEPAAPPIPVIEVKGESTPPHTMPSTESIPAAALSHHSVFGSQEAVFVSAEASGLARLPSQKATLRTPPAFQLGSDKVAKRSASVNTLRDIDFAKTLLPMPLYEMGICLRHGWGVPPSYPASTYFFGLAARLGDVDAQVEYAYCLKKGIGIEKSKMEAAKWFRKAHDQGASIFGESWIHKQKWGGPST